MLITTKYKKETTWIIQQITLKLKPIMANPKRTNWVFLSETETDRRTNERIFDHNKRYRCHVRKNTLKSLIITTEKTFKGRQICTINYLYKFNTLVEYINTFLFW